MTDLNLWLLDSEDLVKYYRPQTEVEAILYAALAKQVADQGWKEIATDNDITELEDRVEELEGEKDILEAELDKHKDFFNYISAAYDKVDGTWPKCEIDNDSWADAIYEHIVNNPLKPNEG